jgi:hypothetical protein
MLLLFLLLLLLLLLLLFIMSIRHFLDCKPERKDTSLSQGRAKLPPQRAKPHNNIRQEIHP